MRQGRPCGYVVHIYIRHRPQSMWRRGALVCSLARVSAALPVRCAPAGRRLRVGRWRARDGREGVALVRLVELGGVMQTVELGGA